MLIKETDCCRICKNRNLIPIMDLGIHALSGRFPAEGEDDPLEAPLVLVKCNDANDSSACGLLQLKHNVSHDELYLHNYGYRSGLNKTMTEHLSNLVKEIEERIQLNPGDIVLDIGRNDATLLKSFSNDLVKIGIDPTGRQFEKFYTKDIRLVPDYFTINNFNNASLNKKAKVITSIAMFYDLSDPLQFVTDVKNALDEDGIWVSEQSYMPLMLEKNSFDTICHEHLEYYSLKQIEWLLNKTGLRLLDVSFNDCNGGSFRFTACHKNASHRSDHTRINSVLLKESETRLNTTQPYDDFKMRVEDIKRRFLEYVNKEKSEGRSIHVYGASTKGNTLLQYFGLDSSIITAAAERNPEKYGRRTPKTRIPIISEDEARKLKPDNFIVLPWHFKNEFLEREKDYLNSGGKFIFPLPNFEVVELQSARKKALITGITGQLGSYLAELLLEKGYEVYGIVRRTSLVNARERLESIRDKINLLYGDVGDFSSIDSAVQKVKPDEIYNLAAQSHVWVSFHMPEYTSDIDAIGALRICEAAKKLDKPVKIYQASTSELFGGIYDYPVNEKTAFHPKSPYAVSKLYAYWTMRNYREAYNMFCSNGIVFNSESPRRGENFVTRKITKGIADIMTGELEVLNLGNLNARRDWGHAKDTAEAMWRILQAENPDDYVIATGTSRSVREFVELAFKYVNIDIVWRGSGIHEEGYDKKTGRVYVKIDPTYFRPSEVNVLIGDSSKAKKELGWESKIPFEDIVREMVEHDLKQAKVDLTTFKQSESNMIIEKPGTEFESLREKIGYGLRI